MNEVAVTDVLLTDGDATAGLADEELLKGFLEGNERCFNEIMHRYRDRVFRLVLRYVGGDRDAAEDIAQQVFVKVFTDGRTFRGEGSLRSWLFSTAVHFAISETRRRSRLSAGPAEIAVEADADGGMDRSQEQARLREAMGRLPEKQRLVMTLRVDADLPFSEIAKAARMSVNSAKVNYHHAVVALKKMLG